MEKSQSIFEKIERYLSNNMSSEEHQDFERQMNEDVDLGKEVFHHKSLQEALKDDESVLFRKKLQQIGNDLKNKKAIAKKFSIWKIAAVLALVVSSSIYFWMVNTNSSGLYQQYYNVYPVEDVLRGEDQNEAIDQVLKKYANKEYLQIIVDLEVLINKHPDNTQLKLYLGNSYLNTDQTTKALEVFHQIQSDDSNFETAQWYLALSHLKADQNEMTISILERIIAYNGSYKQEAISLLRRLK